MDRYEKMAISVAVLICIVFLFIMVAGFMLYERFT